MQHKDQSTRLIIGAGDREIDYQVGVHLVAGLVLSHGGAVIL